MSHTIRPNSQHPDWPTVPDPKLLEAALVAAKDGKERKQAPAKALEATRALAAAAVRVGCSSDNLDWLALVAELRRTIDGCWIDTSCPTIPTEGIEVETTIREGEVWTLPSGFTHQYRYVTITTLETQ
jgi:hypothetical protein